MKKEKLNWIYRNILVIAIGLFVSSNSFAQTIDETIEKTADIEENVVINVKNSNYDLNYKTWDKKKLKVEYNIHIEAKTNEDLNAFHQELEKEIDAQLKDINSGKVNISYPFRKVIKNGGKVKIQFDSGSKTHQLTEFKASIVIHAPKKNELNLNGSFCTINLDDIDANATVKVSSGKFEMGSCKKLKLQSSFCKNMKVGNVDEADLKVSSGDLHLGQIKSNLKLNSSFSNIEISKIGGVATMKLSSSTFKTSDIKELELEGSFIRRFVANNIGKAILRKFSSSEFRANNIKNLNIDNSSFSTFRIALVDKLSIMKSSSSKFYIVAASIVEAPNCSFTDFSISQLKTRFIAKSNSGSIELNTVTSGFDKIKIDGSFVNIDIGVEENSNYKIEAELDFPNYRFKDVNFSNKDKGLSHESLSGWKGNDKNTNSKISFDCKSCSITLD